MGWEKNPEQKENYNVLIVDDRPENLLTLEAIIDNTELNVHKALSGNEALGLMLEHTFSLVLLDVQMPGMDGFEVAEIMRSNPRTREIPIIFITAISKERKHIFRGYEAGAVDYLYKPLDMEVLRSKINAFINFFKQQEEIKRTTARLKEALAEMEKAKQIAENATRAKSSFLANMSHEIRTPLNGIIGMADLVLMDELTENQKEQIKDIKYSGESLLEIINEILDISKIEADKISLESIPFSVNQVIDKIIKLLSVKIFEKDLGFYVHIPDNLHDSVIGDPLRLRQVLVNLLGNAAKFTEHGSIILSITVVEETSDSIKLRFSVKDTGIGIPDDKLDQLFETFSQLNVSTSRKYGGTGLGLSISRQLVGMMGGDIGVESKHGDGCDFHFTLKFKKGRKTTPETLPSEFNNRRFLIYEEEEHSYLVIQSFMTFYKADFERINSLEASFIASKEKEGFNCLIVGCEHSNEDAVLSKLENYNSTLVSQKRKLMSLVLMTNNHIITRNEYFKKIGINQLLMKPLWPQLLRLFFGRMLGGGIIEASINTENDGVEKPYRILLAEDQIINRKIAVGFLGRKGWIVTTAENGQEAYDLYRENEFDIVLMDIQMPEMDGFEATKKIRAFEQGTGKRTPVLAMTAHAMKGDTERILEAGMDAHITKPFKPQHLYATIIDFIEK